VALAIFDLIDKLGVAVFPSHPFGYLLSAFLAALFASFRIRTALQLEILALHHQLGVLQRSVKPGAWPDAAVPDLADLPETT